MFDQTYLDIFCYLKRLVFLLEIFRKQVVDLIVVYLEVGASHNKHPVLNLLSVLNLVE